MYRNNPLFIIITDVQYRLLAIKGNPQYIFGSHGNSKSQLYQSYINHVFSWKLMIYTEAM